MQSEEQLRFLASDAIWSLGMSGAFLLAGLAYIPTLETSKNPLLETRYGRYMLLLDNVTRKDFSKEIMKQRYYHMQTLVHNTLDIPAWWMDAEPAIGKATRSFSQV